MRGNELNGRVGRRTLASQPAFLKEARMKFVLPILAAALLCAAASASAQTVLKKQGDGTRRYVHTTWQSAASADANEASRRLAAARLARERGVQPLARETAQGAPNHRYWQRQEKLRLDVEEARRRSNQAGRTSERASSLRVAASPH
jgi:hypothetical protein